MNVLVSSAGRRGSLIQLIRETFRPSYGRVYAIDAAPWSAACRLADDWQLVPRFDDEGFFDAVADYCREHHIQLIIPTHDRELPVYARLRPMFAELGIHVACSGPRTIEIATDKLQTAQFLSANGLPAPLQIALVDAQNPDPKLPYPLIVKPRHGSCSVGVRVAHDFEELSFYLKRTQFPIVQRQAQGREFTINFLVSKTGICRIAVPHWRVETRGGEVSKCVTVRQPELLRTANQLANALPDAYGPLCFQAFIDHDQQVQIIEVNARLGGGYPIAHQAARELCADVD